MKLPLYRRRKRLSIDPSLGQRKPLIIVRAEFVEIAKFEPPRVPCLAEGGMYAALSRRIGQPTPSGNLA